MPANGRWDLIRRLKVKCSLTCLAMYAQTNVGLLCCVGSGCIVATALGATSSRIVQWNFSGFCYAPTFVPKTRVKSSNIVTSTCSTCSTLKLESAGELWAPPPPSPQTLCPPPADISATPNSIRSPQGHTVSTLQLDIRLYHTSCTSEVDSFEHAPLVLLLKVNAWWEVIPVCHHSCHSLCNSAFYKPATNGRCFIWHSNQDSVVVRVARGWRITVSKSDGTTRVFFRQALSPTEFPILWIPGFFPGG